MLQLKGQIIVFSWGNRNKTYVTLSKLSIATGPNEFSCYDLYINELMTMTDKPVTEMDKVGYFGRLDEVQKVGLLVAFFNELQIQEFVGCFHDEDEDEVLRMYWTHTGENLTEGL